MTYVDRNLATRSGEKLMLSTKSYDVNLLTVLDVKKFRHVFVGEFEISDSSLESALVVLIFRKSSFYVFLNFLLRNLSLSLSLLKIQQILNQRWVENVFSKKLKTSTLSLSLKSLPLNVKSEIRNSKIQISFTFFSGEGFSLSIYFSLPLPLNRWLIDNDDDD